MAPIKNNYVRGEYTVYSSIFEGEISLISRFWVLTAKILSLKHLNVHIVQCISGAFANLRIFIFSNIAQPRQN